MLDSIDTFSRSTDELTKDQSAGLSNKSTIPSSIDDSSPVQPIASIPGMDDAEFRRRGKEMIDYIADYLCHIR